MAKYGQIERSRARHGAPGYAPRARRVLFGNRHPRTLADIFRHF